MGGVFLIACRSDGKLCSQVRGWRRQVFCAFSCVGLRPLDGVAKESGGLRHGQFLCRPLV